MDSSEILSSLSITATIIIAIAGWRITHRHDKEILKLQQSLDEQKSIKERQRKHDEEILNGFMRILRNENKDLIAYLRVEGVSDGYLPSKILSVVDNLKFFCSEPENNFSDEKLKNIQLQMNESIKDLYFYLCENSEEKPGCYDNRIIFPRQHEIYKEEISDDERKEIREMAAVIKEAIEKKTDIVLDTYAKLIENAAKIGMFVVRKE